MGSFSEKKWHCVLELRKWNDKIHTDTDVEPMSIVSVNIKRGFRHRVKDLFFVMNICFHDFDWGNDVHLFHNVRIFGTLIGLWYGDDEDFGCSVLDCYKSSSLMAVGVTGDQMGMRQGFLLTVTTLWSLVVGLKPQFQSIYGGFYRFSEATNSPL